MRVSNLDERFSRLLAEPTADHYLAVRSHVLQQPDHDPGDGRIHELAQQFRNGDFAALIAHAPQLLPTWVLSPRWHYFLGCSLLETGRETDAQRERERSRACLFGLMETGDGSWERPFVITYLSDAYDLLRAHRLHSESQRLIDDGLRRLDTIQASDGRIWHFDVSDLVPASPEKMPLPLTTIGYEL